MSERGKPIVISAPSGTGKSTIIKEVLEQLPEVVFSVSCTTRKPRENEVDGVHYKFLTLEEFRRSIEENRFIEWEDVYGKYYGTEREPMERALNSGKDMLLDLDVKGGERIRELFPDAILISLYPPSYDELRRRIISRGSESEKAIEQRHARYADEIVIGSKYSFQVLNDSVERAVAEIVSIIKTNNKIKVSD